MWTLRDRERLGARTAGARCVAAGLAMGAVADAAAAREMCPDGHAFRGEVVAIGGTVTATDVEGGRHALSLGDALCPGDRVRTGPFGAVEIRLTGLETTVGTPNDSEVLIHPPEAAPDVSLLGGLLRFLSSVRGAFVVRLPHQDAGINGTEALLAVEGPDGASLVLVREGVVTATGRDGARLVLSAGMASFAARDVALRPAAPKTVPPAFQPLLLDPAGATDWSVYYPPVLLASRAEDPRVSAAAERLSAGDPDGAEALLDPLPEGRADRAAALSLLSVAAVFRNDRAAGLERAMRARAADATDPAPYLALSYAEQARGRLDAAFDAARTATDRAPEDAYALARLAELALLLGDRRGAEEAVARSLARGETALARTIAGFAALSADRLDAADTALGRALALESRDPLVHLGLGLVRIRRGDLAEGRARIETAVARDPRRASLRTWLGRAYRAEGRGEKALAQYDLATEADPDDPTAYLLRATRLFEENRPIEALREIERAEAVGGSRAVIRASEGLGEDRAVRSAALGRVFGLLELDQLERAAAARAAAADPSNPEAQALLADAFRGDRTAGIAASSARLRADLLSPPSKTAFQLRTVETDLGLLESEGPTRITFAEFAPAFDSYGLRVDLAGTAGTDATFGDEASVSLLYNGLSVSFGQLYTRTEGFRDNDELENEVFAGQARLAVTPELTLYGEVRSRDSTAGDREQRFDLDDFDPNRELELERDIYRLGLRYQVSPRVTLLGLGSTGMLRTSDLSAEAGAAFGTASRDEFDDIQIQAIARYRKLTLLFGGSYTTTDQVLSSIFPVVDDRLLLLPPPPPAERRIEQFAFYGYATVTPLPELDLTLGLSYANFDDSEPGGVGRRDRVSPKLGLRYALSDRVTLRGALSRALRPNLATEQLLEPTSLAGFSQVIDVTNGAVIDQAALGIDARLRPDLRIGAEGRFRRWDNPVGAGEAPETEDMLFSAFAHKTFGTRWAFRLGFAHERASSDLSSDLDDFRLTRVPATLSYFDRSGLFGSVTLEPVWHRFEDGAEVGEDSFLMLNAGIGYRLGTGRGIVTLEGQNLLDRDIGFEDRRLRLDIEDSPRFARGLTVTLRAAFRF
ncbi:MAG: TonB-dependent receptor domain-containing protein [Paracoccaceae bacterium]